MMMKEENIPYLSWYVRQSKTPEWIFDMIFTPSPHEGSENRRPAARKIVVNAPLFAYDYRSSIEEKQLANHSVVVVKFGLSEKYHVMKALMCNETLVDLALIRLDGTQKTMRTLIFGQCHIVTLKEYNGEVVMSLNYNFCGDSIKTDQGVSAMDWNYDEYAGSLGHYQRFSQYLEDKSIENIY